MAGDKIFEEKLKIINQAYATLKARLLQLTHCAFAAFNIPPRQGTTQEMPTVQPAAPTATPTGEPDIKISVRQTFGIDSDLEVPAFSQPSEHVPDLDEEAYRFDHDTTLAITSPVLPSTGG